MTLKVSASAVKSWFQYRCERKLVYDTMSDAERDAIPIEQQYIPQPWAELGNSYEQEVVAAYIESGVAVRMPPPGADDIGERASLDFLAGKGKHQAAHQVVLTPNPLLAKHLGLEDVDVDFRRGLVDLIVADNRDGKRFLRIVDIKATHAALPFHKTQVAWYAWMLRAVLEQHRIEAEIEAVGAIWHRPAAGKGVGPYVSTSFFLRPYESVVLDWTRRELRQAVNRKVTKEQDPTRFHVYFKCEQCKYLPHCERALRPPRKPQNYDVSAVPGLSQQTKASLLGMGIRTVGDLARAGARVTSADAHDWKLSTRGVEFVARAKALVEGKVALLNGAVTLRMPPYSHLHIHLLADRDPMRARLATIGVLVDRNGESIERCAEIIGTTEAEAQALRKVLALVVKTLIEVDRENQDRGQIGLHLFVYEPADSRDLAEALGRHLRDRGLMSDLLHVLRIFPPESVVPEPGYKSVQHLPACALRTVVEEVLAMPVVVSTDLTRVSEALASMSPGPKAKYCPEESFRRPFSARLGLNHCSDLHSNKADTDAILKDVHARLDAQLSIARFLEELNERAPDAEKFLRLEKQPFRLQETFDPLAATDLDLLCIQALLESRVGLVSALDRLADPTPRRAARQRCLADLKLVKTADGRFGGKILVLAGPQNVADVDIKADDPLLLLTDGHPDRVLSYTAWGNFRVKLLPPTGNYPSTQLGVVMSNEAYESDAFQELLEDIGDDARWVLDRGHYDVNSDRLGEFLRYLDGDGAE